MYQKDLKETKWRRDRIGIARARETERGKREIKNAGVKDREEEKEREREERVDQKLLEERERKLQEGYRGEGEGGERGEGSTSTSRWFVFSLFPRGLLINYCD